MKLLFNNLREQLAEALINIEPFKIEEMMLYSLLPFVQEPETMKLRWQCVDKIYLAMCKSKKFLIDLDEVFSFHKTYYKPGNKLFNAQVGEPRFKLPFDICYFEFQCKPAIDFDPVSVLVSNDYVKEHSVLIDIFLTDHATREWKMFDPFLSTILDTRTLELSCINNDNNDDDASTSVRGILYDQIKKIFLGELDNDKRYWKANYNLRSIIGYFLHTMAALDNQKVKTKFRQPKRKTQERRKKAGKKSLVGYSTIEIPLEVEVISGIATRSKEHQGGKHASPRQHVRRGHWRQYKDKRVWIDPMLVGDASNGVMDQDYKVVMHSKQNTVYATIKE